jgi:hypothetical protein
MSYSKGGHLLDGVVLLRVVCQALCPSLGWQPSAVGSGAPAAALVLIGSMPLIGWIIFAVQHADIFFGSSV